MEIVFKNSKKAIGIRISIKPGGKVLITKPFYVPTKIVEKMIQDKKGWIEENVKKQLGVKSLKSERKEYLDNKVESRKIIISKINKLNKFYKFNFNKVIIKNQSTRWGSCSSLKNLSFNWQVARLSDDLFTYVVVHELCHLKEMNHSVKFWDLVAKKIPNFKLLRRTLIKEGVNLI